MNNTVTHCFSKFSLLKLKLLLVWCSAYKLTLLSFHAAADFVRFSTSFSFTLLQAIAKQCKVLISAVYVFKGYEIRTFYCLYY